MPSAPDYTDLLIRQLPQHTPANAAAAKALRLPFDDGTGTNDTAIAKQNTIDAVMTLAYALRGALTASNLTLGSDRLAGRTADGNGAVEEISVGAGLALADGALTAEVTQAELDAAIDTINDALALLAPLASPALTGTPTAPTAAPGTNTTQIANTAFVGAAITTALTSVLKHRGDIACNANPNYPTATIGDCYVVSMAGKIGGSSGILVEVGDLIVCRANSASGNQATVGSNWYRLEANIPGITNFGISLVQKASVLEARNLLSVPLLREECTVNGFTNAGTNEVPATPPAGLDVNIASLPSGTLIIEYSLTGTPSSFAVTFGAGTGFDIDTTSMTGASDAVSAFNTWVSGQATDFSSISISAATITFTIEETGSVAYLRLASNTNIDASSSGGGAGNDAIPAVPPSGEAANVTLINSGVAMKLVRLIAIRNPGFGSITSNWEVITNGGVIWTIPLGNWATLEWIPTLETKWAMTSLQGPIVVRLEGINDDPPTQPPNNQKITVIGIFEVA